MKNILNYFAFAVLLASGATMQAQIKTNTTAVPSIASENAFLDASSFIDYANNDGKGLVFPRTDLTQWVFTLDIIDGVSTFPTAFDGMIVYNSGTGNTLSGQGIVTTVSPGFYYFYNPTGNTDIAAGKWLPFLDKNNLPDTTTHIMGLAGNTLTSTVNGKSATSSAVSGVSNALTGSSLSTTVNGVTGTSVDITPAVTSALPAATTHTMGLAGNTLTSTVNGKSATSSAVSGVSNTLTGSSLSTTVNGVTGISVDITPAVTSALPAATTNTLGLVGNTLTSTVNGKSATSSAVSGVSNTLTGSSMTTTVNGVTGTAVNIAPAVATTAWSLDGNAGNATKFIGTTDANPFVIKTNNVETMRVTSAGNAGIGVSAPTAKLDVNGNVKISDLALGTASPVTGKVVLADSNGLLSSASAPTAPTTKFLNGAGDWAVPNGVGDNLGNHTATQEIVTSTANAFRMKNTGNPSFLLRNDGNAFYILMTNPATPDGLYNAFRPLTINALTSNINSGSPFFTLDGGTFVSTNSDTGSLTAGAAWFKGSGGSVLFDDVAHKRFSWNDGGGNLNIRSGNYFNTSVAKLQMVQNAANQLSGAATISLNSDFGQDGSITLSTKKTQLVPNVQFNDDEYDNRFRLTSSDGIAYLGKPGNVLGVPNAEVVVTMETDNGGGVKGNYLLKNKGGDPNTINASSISDNGSNVKIDYLAGTGNRLVTANPSGYLIDKVAGTNAEFLRGDGAWATLDSNAWSLAGNTGNASKFIGTTDANPLVFKTNNIEYMRIAGSGNVGIGTIPNVNKLDIVSDQNNGDGRGIKYTNYGTAHPFITLRRAKGSTSNPAGLIAGDYLGSFSFTGYDGTEFPAADFSSGLKCFAAQTWSGGKNGSYLAFYTTANDQVNAGERMVIANDGNVGIGTSTPTYNLTVGGIGSVFGVDNGANFSAKNSAGNYEPYFWPRNSTNGMYLNYGSAGFFIRNNTNTTTMFMSDANDVGIGTLAPTEKLHVVGGARISGLGAGIASPVGAKVVLADGSGTLLAALAPTAPTTKFLNGNGDWAVPVVGSGQIADGTITAADIAPSAVTTSEILNGTILSADIADGTITAADIAASAVTTNEILNGTILAQDIATGGVNGTNILDGTIGAIDIAASAVTTNEILNSTILSADIADGTITAADIAASAVTTNEILNATILAQDIATGGVNSTNILDGTVTSTDLASGTGGIYKGSGSLSGATTVTLGGNLLTVAGSGNFVVPTSSVGIGNSAPAYRLDVTGQIRCTANMNALAYVTTSDIRLKSNIKDLSKGLQTISALRPVSYEKKESIDATVYNTKENGFIAQEVYKILPDLVTVGEDKDKTMSINYTAIIPILTKAIQEQQAQIEAQQAQINELKALILGKK